MKEIFEVWSMTVSSLMLSGLFSLLIVLIFWAL
jgi:hypothetical protein